MSQLQQAWHPAIIELFEIDLSTIGDGAGGVYRFTNDARSDGESVSAGGQSYTPFPIDATGFEVTTKGSSPQPRITIANVLGTMSAAAGSAQDLVGAKVTRRRILNGGGEQFPDDVFYITRKVSESNLAITWELGSRIDLEGLQLPKRIITQNYCVWKYKGPECGYSGGPVANAANQIPEGTSSEARAYTSALSTSGAAGAAVNNARAELAAAQNEVDAVCSVDVVEKSKPKFNLRSGKPYSFAIQDNNQYFAAYNENDLVSESKFNYAFGDTKEGDAVYGETQNTGKGNNSNGTGSIYGVNRWTKDNDGEVTVQSVGYSPPRTFGFYGIDGGVIIALNGTILSESQVSNVSPGKEPSLSRNQILYALSSNRAETSVGPVRSLIIWQQGTDQCDTAQERLAAAEAALEQALADAEDADGAVGGALDDLPSDDPLFGADECGKSLTSCRLRFGNGPLPFGGFPGANIYR